jgi:type 1 fimbriae regulatory protein FimB/type 1 fimbriae regulatory protein FimE
MVKYAQPTTGATRNMGRLIKLPQPSKMGKLPPRRVLNSERRSREYLSPAEVDSMITAAKNTGRYGHRDATLILLTYRHAARVSEVIAWRRDQVDLEQGLLHINRLKNGTPSVHPLRGPEIRALRKLFREYSDSPYVFSTERKGPMTAGAVRKIVARAGELAEVGFPVHPHMLRHATGYYLASKGQDTRAIQAYMGHKNIQHTVRYTELSSERFKNFWKD